MKKTLKVKVEGTTFEERLRGKDAWDDDAWSSSSEDAAMLSS